MTLQREIILSILYTYMTDLSHWQEKIQEVKRTTPFRDFLKEIASLRTLGFYRNGWYPSVYPESQRIQRVVSHAEFEANRDTLTQQWLTYDFSKDFFENFKLLFKSIDQPPTWLFEECENCSFSDQTVASKNCYLSYVTIINCENILYSLSVKEGSVNVFNSVLVWAQCENIYFSSWVISSFNIFYAKYIQNSSNVRFSSNLTWCTECLFCDNLVNQSYCIDNQVVPKDIYFEKKREILAQKEKFLERYLQLSNQGNNIASHDVSWNFNIQCEHIEEGYGAYQVKDWRNIILIGGNDTATHIYDCFLNTPPQNHYYGTFSAGYGEHIYNSYHIKWGTNVYYSVCLENSSYCLGCVGLRNKQFCILNKQYTKEEWLTLANKIFAHMEEGGILGKFFPGSFNPFYFNDTAAYLIDDSFTKEEVEKEGYLRRDKEITVDIPSGSEVVEVADLDQLEWRRDESGKIIRHAELNSVSSWSTTGDLSNPSTGSGWQVISWWIDPAILKKVIRDEKGDVYRIVKTEYDFLVKHALPLPKLHWLQRIKCGFRFK